MRIQPDTREIPVTLQKIQNQGWYDFLVFFRGGAKTPGNRVGGCPHADKLKDQGCGMPPGPKTPSGGALGAPRGPKNPKPSPEAAIAADKGALGPYVGAMWPGDNAASCSSI